MWEGVLNRSDLVERFGISPNQATADLAQFAASQPEAMHYDRQAKTYRAGAALVPEREDAGILLRELRLIGEGMLSGSEGMLAHAPAVDVAEPPVRYAAGPILTVLLSAIRGSRQLSASYQSFSRPKPRRLKLEPHALLFDGFRWHARARDVDDNSFKDFVLGRIEDAILGPEVPPASIEDRDWHERVRLTIAPHPGLSAHQTRAIELDYCMDGGTLELSPRRAVVFYVKRRLGLLAGHHDRPAHEQHIVLREEKTM